ncbi:protein-disulfide reductase DsbD [Aquabacterium sp. J223]|uniref:protein-disulfide reductase DsbD family protein n=1 Tax=Aquabacterium sp. J223 TaxID=2898431 RepID=UPI0021AD9002|nr:protein-disulfide reductase DsbD domain-containing protein [Aquabacterium sp. J223]UUX96085.1 thioredoxin family protein [Aquabacterium sp. J223]
MPFPALRFVVPAVLLAALLPATSRAQTTTVTTEQVRAELVADAPQGVVPGAPVMLGLRLQHAPHWHTYWKNPGDSGLPTLLTWTLPLGVEAGDIEWPLPKRLPVGPLMNHGYEGEVLLPVPLTVPPGFAAPTLDVRLKAEWLVCKEVCIPQSGEFRLQLPTQAATAGHRALFDAARRALPQPLADARAEARLEDHALVLEVGALPAAWRGQSLQLLPETPAVLAAAATPQQQWQAERYTARLPLAPERAEAPAMLPLVLATAAGQSVRIEVPVRGPWPAPGSTPAPAPSAEPIGAVPTDGALPATLALAFLGGLLLNLMPCVFPVLSLKLLSFAARRDSGRQRVAGALAYGAGVLASMLALAALLLALRAGGEQLGWGFQLQSPTFVAALAALFTLIGLNLVGAYGLGGALTGRLAGLQARHPLADQALTGVLAVVVASPCSAPFMGAALGAALTLDTLSALSVFAALGLGLAAPYVAAAAWPRLARRLPRPGAWMATLKTLLAFPIFATVVWLLWVLGQQVGLDGAMAWLGVLLALAFCAWAWAGAALARGGRLVLGGLSLAVLVWATAASLAWLDTAEPAAPAVAADTRWRPWSRAAVDEARGQGRPVFVDFTAAWCVSCQVNKLTTLSRPELLADFADRRVLLLRADWTRRDAAITAELQRLGRSGVPVYVLYGTGTEPPHLLPEVLTVAGVRQALSGLAPAP